MRRITAVVLIAVTGLLLQTCTDKTTQPPPTVNPPGPENITPTEKNLLESSNRFGLKLFGKVSAYEDAGENIFISPLSVSFALGMCYNGSAGSTRDAMAATLEFPDLTPAEINQSYRNIIDILTKLDPYVAFRIANSIWYRNGFPISGDFVDLNQTYFDAEVREIDFSRIWAADTINHWVDVNTEGKITEIIIPPIPESAVMYLINALYFNGGWTLPFDPEATIDINFHLDDGTTVQRPLMWTDTTLRYFDNDLFQAVDLPYGDEHFSMSVLLPLPGHTVDDIILELNDQTWAQWAGSFEETGLELFLPRFKFAYDITLNDILKAMGMGVAFSQNGADFSNMVSDMSLLPGNLYISFVKHKTFVQVDEEGTEAAAVTVVGIDVTSIEPVMMVNRPFLFIIHEHETGSILFMGKVSDPVWEE